MGGSDLSKGQAVGLCRSSASNAFSPPPEENIIYLLESSFTSYPHGFLLHLLHVFIKGPLLKRLSLTTLF